MLGVQFVQLPRSRRLRPVPVTPHVSLRILLVDDEPAIRKGVGRYLRQRGCAVEIAADGAKALDLVARVPFDAIITDVEMPVMDGETLWRRTVALHPELGHRFLFCTGSSLPASLAADPRIRVLAKPFELSELWTALTDLLSDTPSSAD
jgi:CheY-like chemotaxis protein